MQVLVFSQSLLVLDLIEDMLGQSKKRGTGLVDGKGRTRKWQYAVDYFRLDGSVRLGVTVTITVHVTVTITETITVTVSATAHRALSA